MTDLDMIRTVLGKIPNCIVVNQDTYIEAAGQYGYENVIFEFDNEGNLTAFGC